MYLSFTFNNIIIIYAQETIPDASIEITEINSSITLADTKLANQNSLQIKANNTNTLYPFPQSVIGPDTLSLLELITFSFFSLLTLNRALKNKKP
jgi:hypothetical protein